MKKNTNKLIFMSSENTTPRSSTPPSSGKMSRYELEKLLKLSEREAKALKLATEARKAQVIAEGEAMIASTYSPRYKPAWEPLFLEAKEIADRLNAMIIEDLKEEGVPVGCCPRLNVAWKNRGEKDFAERRTELKAVLKSEAAAQQKTAITQIELWLIKSQKELLPYGMESEDAKRLLLERPSLETLMPSLQLESIEKKLDEIPRLDRWKLRR
jgi:hypothetical protein